MKFCLEIPTESLLQSASCALRFKVPCRQSGAWSAVGCTPVMDYHCCKAPFIFPDTPELKTFFLCDNQDILPKQTEVYFSIDPLQEAVPQTASQNRDKMLLRKRIIKYHRLRKEKIMYFRSKTFFTEQKDLSYGKQEKLWFGTLVIYLCFHSLPMWLG